MSVTRGWQYMSLMSYICWQYMSQYITWLSLWLGTQKTLCCPYNCVRRRRTHTNLVARGLNPDAIFRWAIFASTPCYCDRGNMVINVDHVLRSKYHLYWKGQLLSGKFLLHTFKDVIKRFSQNTEFNSFFFFACCSPKRRKFVSS